MCLFFRLILFVQVAPDCFCVKGKGVQLVKKKKTIYPEWNTSFDFHLYEGRVIHLEILQRPDTKVAECSILAQSLADMAKDGEATSVWVITHSSSTLSRFRIYTRWSRKYRTYVIM